MSKQVDERVVSMQFDNKEFESNVKTSMGTIDKLKEKLNFKGASKGMESVMATTKQFTKQSQSEFESYKSGIFSIGDAWRKMWSSMEYEAANKLKNIFNMFTIEPIKTGFNEYELKMGSIQTIMASTGESLETVNKYLDELNQYSDDTIYSFSDMTSNIGKFTNAGVKLEDAVKAIKGISNEAALSGANANEASRAMYNFSQALSAGYVKLIDWKSIENANMATVGFKEELIKTAVAVGTLTDAGNGMYETLDGTVINATKNFNDSLQDQWMTSEVLITTLGKYADETTDIGKKATAAATEVKTFSMMMDTLKESAQSGWARTWELLIGNFEEGKTLWTDLSKVLGGFIDKFNNLRNDLIESAFGKTLTGISDGVKNVLDMTGKVTEPIEKVTESLEDFDAIVNKVIKGDFGNGRERYAKLSEAGWNYYKVQNKVNEVLGDSHRYTQKEIDDQEKLLGNVEKTTEATEEQKEETVKLTKEQKERIKSLMYMTEEQLRNEGCTEDQIEAIKNLGTSIVDLGVPIDTTDQRFQNLIDNIDNLSGRFLWIESLKNIGRSILEIFKSIGAAWSEIFPSSAESRAEGLFNFLINFYKTTNKILNGIKDNSEELTRIFKGVFAVVDIFATLGGSAIKLTFDAINAVLSGFGTDLLSVMAWLADGIVLVRDWIDAHNPIVWLFKKLGEIMKKAADAWRNWIDGFAGAENKVKYIVEGIAKGLFGGITALGGLIIDAFKALGNVLIEDAKKILGENVVDGFIEGVKDGYNKVVETLTNFANNVIETVKELFGIHSPSVVFYAIGMFLILGLINGVEDGFAIVGNVFKKLFDFVANICKNAIDVLFGGDIWGKLKEFWQNVKDAFSKGWDGIGLAFDAIKKFFGAIFEGFDWGSAISVLLTGGLIYALVNLSKVLTVFGDLAGTFADLTEKFNKTLGSISFKMVTGGILDIAKAIALIIGAIVVLAYACQQISPGAILSALGITVLLIGLIAGFVITLKVLDKKLEIENGKFEALNMASLGVMLTGVALALLTFAGALAIIAGIGVDESWRAFGIISIFTIVLGALISFAQWTSKHASAGKMFMLTTVITAVGYALLAMAFATKIIASIDNKDGALKNVAWTIIGFGAVLAALVGLTAFGKQNIGKLALLFVTVGAVMIAIAWAMKSIGSLEVAELNRAEIVMLGVFGFLTAFLALSQFVRSKTDLYAVAALFISVGIAVVAIAKAIEIVGTIDQSAAIQGGIAIVGVIGVLTAIGFLVRFVKLKSDLYQLAALFVGVGIATIAIAYGLKALGSLTPEQLKQSFKVLSGIALVLGVLTAVLSFGNYKIEDSVKNLTNLFISVGIGILGIALALKTVSKIPEDKLLSSIGTIVVLMGALLGMTVVMSKIKGGLPKTAKLFMSLGIAIMLIATSIALLSILDPAKMWSALGTIAVLMGMIALISLATKGVKDIKGTFIGLAIALGTLALALSILTLIPTEKLLPATAALTVVMGALALVIYAISKIKVGKNQIWKIITIFGLLIVAIGGIVAALIVLADKPWTGILAGALGLSIVLLAMVAVISVIKRMTRGTKTLNNFLATLGVLTAIVVVLSACLWLVSQNDPVRMLAGALALAAILIAITVVLSIIKNVKANLSSITSMLVAMAALTAVVGIMAAILWAASGLDPVQAIAMTGVLAAFAGMVTVLLLVMNKVTIGMGNLLQGIAGLALITVVIGLMAGVLLLTSGLDPTQAIAMTGVLTVFAAMVTILLIVINNININTANLLLGIAGLALITIIVGAMAAILVMTKDVDPGQAALMATILSVFVLAMIAIGVALGAAVGLLGAGVAGAALLVAIIAIIFGGITATIYGCSFMLPEIGENLSKFTSNMQGFIDAVSAIDDSVLVGIGILCGAILALTASGLISGVTNFCDKVKSWFGGKSSLETLLDKFAKAIVGFSKAIDGKINISAVNTAATAFESIAKVKDINVANVDNAVKAIKKIQDLAVEMSDSNYSGLSEFGSALEKVAKEGITKFTEAFDNSYDKVLTSVNNMISNTATSVKTEENYGKFVSVGEYFVSGFAQGIINKKSEAAGEAAAVASAAMDAMKAELKEHSPSKETYKIGGFAGQGFVNAFIDYTATAFAAGSDLAKSASDGLTKALSQVQEVVDSDMDVQPTIRPVLDLSDVRAGVGQLNGLLDTNSSIGVEANISSIRRAMQNNQNGTTNDDVVAAIEGLGNKLDEASGDTYIIEGITYDDGSNIADAVGSIVRAAKIERRI